jgi:probable DNA metabolism protein
MIIFHYDKSFEGLLSVVFDAYLRRSFPEQLLALNEPEPLFTVTSHTVYTESEKTERVWKSLEKKVEKNTLNMISYAWLSELPGADELIYRYICKTFDSPYSIETNFADKDVLQLRQLAQKVSKEKHRMIEFIRFQKTADDTYFAPIHPDYNVIPLIVTHFKNRYADQEWIIYDTGRNYGMHFNTRKLTEVSFTDTSLFPDGKINEELLADNEQLYQQLWKKYFKAITIKERINPKLHRQHLPKRYWKYLTEKG